MTTRFERVVLDLEDRFTDPMLRAAAATSVLKHELNDLDGTSTRANRSTSDLGGSSGGLSKTERQASSTDKSIDKLSGRLSLLTRVAAALGPGLVPIGAVGIPAVAGLSSELGFAAVGAGTTMLAFHGLGDALNKFNKASAEPTATNLAAAQLALDKLPPSAQAFVLELHRLNPELDKLRRSAGEGVFPGLTDGLKAVTDDGPLAQRILRDVGNEVGSLGREAGESLSSNRWRPFLRFVDREAPDAVHHLGESVGDVTHGLAQLWMAFDPMNDQVDEGILRLARDFDTWATGLGKTKDFQSFMEYIESNGPKVTELVGETRDLFVNLVQAAAPLGGPTLDALNLILQVLNAIASSPLATPLLALVQVNAILKLVSQGMGTLGVNAKIGFGGVALGAKESSTALTGLRAEASATGSALKTLWGNVGRNASTGSPLLAGVNKEGLRNLGLGAGLAAGMAFQVSGLDEKMGLSNTTMLAMAGLMAGPWGAAAGGAIGLLLDMHDASGQAASGQKQLDAVLADGTSTWQQYASAIADARKAYADNPLVPLQGAGSDDRIKGVISHPVFAANDALHGIFGTSLTDQAKDAATQAEHVDEAFRYTFTDLAKQWNSSFLAPKGGFTPASLNDTQIGAIITRAQPAMDALGISLGDLQNAYDANDGSLDKLLGKITTWTARSETAAGRTDAVAKAFAHMSDQAATTEDRVTALGGALDALFDPQMSLIQAEDAWHKGLNDLDGALVKHHRTLVGTTDVAIQNRGAILDQVSSLKQMIEAQAQVDPNAKRLTATMQRARQTLIETGVAAGLNRDQLVKLINQMGLTPKLIRTTLSLVGVDQAAGDLDKLRQQLLGLRDRTIHIWVRTDHLGASDTTATGGHVMTNARGGTVPGRRCPYGDKVLSWVAPGEEIISNLNGQADRHRTLLKAINAGHYARGGTVTRDAMTTSSAQRLDVRITAGALTGSIDTPMGAVPIRAAMEAVARDVYTSEYDKDSDHERAMSGG